jgi:hypothetical protein
VRFESAISSFTDFPGMSGKIATFPTETGELRTSLSPPTMPFQLLWVLSEMLCASAAELNVLDPVIDADGEGVFSWLENIAELVAMRYAQRVVHSDGLPIDPDLGLPVAAFEKQLDVRTRPAFRHLDILLIPGRSHVVEIRDQPEREPESSSFKKGL